MIRPQKMKHIEMTVLKKDIDAVLEYLGRNEVIHFTVSKKEDGKSDTKNAGQFLEYLRHCAEFLNLELPAEPEPDSIMPGEAEQALLKALYETITELKTQSIALLREKQQIEETINEANAFTVLNAPFSDLDHLSYLTLRPGRLDPKDLKNLKNSLGNRAVIIPFGKDNTKILAISSRKGRFALDTELKRYSFSPITIPKDHKGIPPELIHSLNEKLNEINKNLDEINKKRDKLRTQAAGDLKRLAESFLIALSVEEIKRHLKSTENIFLLSGWVVNELLPKIVSDLSALCGGRAAIRSFNPDELADVKAGKEKVPVSLKHCAFVKGFQSVVLSYGAPVYGTIDPTPLVAVFFTLLFGIMFGDVGHGFVLFLAGILVSKYGPKKLQKFKAYSIPLISIGITSMIMGFLIGSVFTNENLLVKPSRAITAALTGNPMDHILVIMPLAEHGGSIRKLLLFFVFTIFMGIVLISIGLIIQIANSFIIKKYKDALFSKNGLSGLLFLWYAVFVGIRCALGDSFRWFDLMFLLIPCFFIFFKDLIWRIIIGKKPLLEHGFIAFFMEGFVEILETLSSYIANTVSFLRVGAFTLSHAVLSYIVFRFSEALFQWNSGPAGTVLALFIMVFGNLVIIILEGMIVAIQVMRLQYYEFFSKFFINTGMEFSPFRFGKKLKE